MAWMLIVLVLALVAAIVIFFLIKDLLKASLTALSIICGTLLILSLIVYVDANRLNKNFFSQPSLFLLQEEGTMLAGLVGRVQEMPTYVAREGLSSYQQQLASKEYATMRGEYYRVFVFHPLAFGNLQGEFRFGEIYLNKDEAIQLLRSSNALQQFAELVISERGTVSDSQAAKQAVVERFSNQEELKSMLLSSLIAQATQEQGNQFVPFAYRTKMLFLYPKSPYFEFIESVPYTLYRMMIR